ncbi:hypothetical protein BDZ91DRAFT_461131 [Kalaharituber pfeilii]|nr:hypothetical protein BDZ91DRAFT_461131 [Kalaharituber pfeilii]
MLRSPDINKLRLLLAEHKQTINMKLSVATCQTAHQSLNSQEQILIRLEELLRREVTGQFGPTAVPTAVPTRRLLGTASVETRFLEMEDIMNYAESVVTQLSGPISTYIRPVRSRRANENAGAAQARQTGGNDTSLVPSIPDGAADAINVISSDISDSELNSEESLTGISMSINPEMPSRPTDCNDPTAVIIPISTPLHSAPPSTTFQCPARELTRSLPIAEPPTSKSASNALRWLRFGWCARYPKRRQHR